MDGSWTHRKPNVSILGIGPDFKILERSHELQLTNIPFGNRYGGRGFVVADLFEEQYRIMIEHSNDMIWTLDREGNFTFFNKRAEELSGYSAREWKGKSFAPMIPAEDLPRIQQVFQDTMKGTPRQYEIRVQKKDGGFLVLAVNTTPVIEGDVVVGTVSFGRDITVEKRALEELKKLSSAVQQAADHVLITDKRGVIEYVNPAFERLTEYGKDEMIGNVATAFGLGADGQASSSQSFEPRKNHAIRPTTLLQKKKSGEEYYEEVTVTPLVSSGGEITHFVVTGRDITERRRMIETLEQSEANYRTIVEGTIDVIYTSTPDFQINFVSAQVATLGYSCDEFVGRRLTDFVHSEDMKSVVDSERRLLRTGAAPPLFFRFLRKDGTSVQMEGINRVLMVGGKVTLITGVLRDVSDRIKLETQLFHAQKLEAMGKMAGEIAHDFNNLLGVIVGFSSLLLDRLEKDSPFRANVEEIMKTGQRAASLSQQLLAVSRRQPLRRTPGNLNALIMDMKKVFELLAGAEIKLVLALEPDLHETDIDLSQMQQVLMNLVVNARDAMPRGGTLTLRTGNIVVAAESYKGPSSNCPERAVCLSVEDTGTGMSKNVMDHLFEAFFSTKAPGKGTGLGLSVVYGIVKQHDGWIDVSSEIGQGTKIKVCLPTGAIAAASEEIKSQTSSPGLL